jgi:predicted transposase/invertase (TIGR01784 family)
MRQLYDRGMSGPDIRNLYEFIDWTMMLPEALETEFWQELKTFEEEQSMAYVTSAERFGRREKAQEIALKMLKKGMGLETIAELTDLPIAQIQQLQTELNRN